MTHRSRGLLEAALLQSCRAVRQSNAAAATENSGALAVALRCMSAARPAGSSDPVGALPPSICSSSPSMSALLHSACQVLPSKRSDSRHADHVGMKDATHLGSLQSANYVQISLPQLAWGHAASSLQAGALADILQQRRSYASNSSGSDPALAASNARLGDTQHSQLAQSQSSGARASDDGAASVIGSTSSRTSAAAPGSWLERRCPRKLLPYAQLMRLDKPIGES